MSSSNNNNSNTDSVLSSSEIEFQVQQLRESDGDLQVEAILQETSSNKNYLHDRSDQPTTTTTTTTTNSQHKQPFPFSFVPLTMGGQGRTHVPSEGSRRIINEEVSLQDLQAMTTLFYKKAFLDPTLDQFIRSHNDPHGERFAKWIHQKLSDSTVWDEDRRTRNLKPVVLAGGRRHVVSDRTSAHVAAWYSTKRPAQDVGRHFELDEARVWMRLHFWALRESGILEQSPSFADYYIRFIAHFVRVYESTAPAFARESFRWSADPKNTELYIRNGRRMVDVLGLSLEEAEEQIPEYEANDWEWPYNQQPRPLDF